MLVAGAPPYLFDIIKGKTKPERATWFIWGMLGVIAFVSQFNLHGGWSLVFVGFDATGSVLVFLLSLKYGIGGWKTVDKIALIVATVGVILSVVAHRPVVALLGVVLADLSGAVLTFIKTYHAPSSETTITWLFIGTASLFGALSVGKIDWGLLIFPIYLVFANFGVVAAQALGRIKK
jgi:NADH:ubiquinone oxidoreductase subunit 2 (subunit N)